MIHLQGWSITVTRKAVTRMLVKLIEQGKLRYNGEDNYSRIIRTLTSVVDVVNESTGRIMSGESWYRM